MAGTRLSELGLARRDPAAGIPYADWAAQVAARRRDLIGALTETVLDRRLTPVKHTAIDLALADAVRSSEVPILPMVVERILTPSATDDPDGRLTEDCRMVGHTLRRLVAGDLSGLFDGPSTEKFGPTLPMLPLGLSRVAENSALLAVLMTCSAAWMEAALQDPSAGNGSWSTTRPGDSCPTPHSSPE